MDNHTKQTDPSVKYLVQMFPEEFLRNLARETGSIYDVRVPVEFDGTGRDPEDGILTNFSLVWYSDINRAIGAGERFDTVNISCGAHRITLRVNDGVGLTSTSHVTLTITNRLGARRPQLRQ